MIQEWKNTLLVLEGPCFVASCVLQTLLAKLKGAVRLLHPLQLSTRASLHGNRERDKCASIVLSLTKTLATTLKFENELINSHRDPLGLNTNFKPKGWFLTYSMCVTL